MLKQKISLENQQCNFFKVFLPEQVVTQKKINEKFKDIVRSKNNRAGPDVFFAPSTADWCLTANAGPEN